MSTLQAQLDQGEETGSALVTAAKALDDDVAQQLGATSEDLAATQQDLDDAQQAAEQAEQDAAAAKEKAAESKAAVAADCAKAYVSAFGALFEGESAQAQAPVVREQHAGITADYQTALAGT